MNAAPRPSLLRRLGRSDRGASLVEFAMLLPMLVFLFAVVVEGGRIAWSYQTAISGVRDATRYLGRVVSTDVCAPGRSMPNLNAQLLSIARANLTYDSSGGVTRRRSGLIPSAVTVNSVTSSLDCSIRGSFRVSPPPVATVTARLTITFPFGSLFELVGAEIGTVTTTITDRTRLFGA